MNFFKSVFSDESDPPSPDPEPEPEHESTSSPPHEHPNPDSDPNPSQNWSFGGLIKTLQVKSDWIESYRRDLQEFGSGLKKETEVLRDVASKAVLDLPDTIDISASKAQLSLETVGYALDSIGSSVWKSTTEIISHGKDSLLNLDNNNNKVNDIETLYDSNSSTVVNNNVVGSGKYSRFDAQLRAIQCDLNTYVTDVDDFDNWRDGFRLDEKRDEIDVLLRENDVVDGFYRRVVPESVDGDLFWCRYFYRVFRLVQAENVRAELVKRAISTEDEEELTWEVDDDDEEDEGRKDVHEVVEVSSHDVVECVNENEEEVSSKGVQSEENSEVNDEPLKKSEEKVTSEIKADASESGKESDVSVVSTQPSHEEDDMGWDEIEDIGSDDEKKVSQSGGSNKDDLRKRLSVAAVDDDDDEDLSWDIEEDD